MTLVVLIRVFRLFHESKLVGIEDINDPKCFREDPWKFGSFKNEN